MADFDRFSSDYKERHNRNIAISGETTEYFARLKLDLVKQTLAARADSPFSLLDIGAGVGKIQESLHTFLPACLSAAVDISFDSLSQAKKAAAGSHLFAAYDGRRLPFPSGSFDAVLLCTVLHHIPPPDRPAFTREAARVLKSDGLLFVFEHNPFNPLTKRIVAACEFDDDAVLLPPGETRRLLIGCGLQIYAHRYYVFFPGALKALRPLEPLLARLPLGGQYMTVGAKK